MLTIEKVKREFTYLTVENSGFYFAEIIYDESEKFYDLYIRTEKNKISQNQIDTYNDLSNHIEVYAELVEEFMPTTLSNYEQKRAPEINKRELNLYVLEVQEESNNFDSVLVYGKQ